MPVASVPDTTLPMEIRYTVCTGNEKDLRPQKKYIFAEWSWVPDVECLPCSILARIFLPLVQMVLLLPPVLAVPVLYKRYSQHQVYTASNWYRWSCSSHLYLLYLLLPHVLAVPVLYKRYIHHQVCTVGWSDFSFCGIFRRSR